MTAPLLLRFAGAVLGVGGAWRLAAATPPPPGSFPLGSVLLLVAGAALFGLSVGPDDRPAELAVGEAPSRHPTASAAFDRDWGLAAAGLAAACVLAYAILGWSAGLLALWIGGMYAAVRALRAAWVPVPDRARLDPGEYGVLLAVVLALALLVLPELARMPYEISTDEIYYASTVRDFASGRARDAFGLAEWWGLPAFHFWAVARLVPFVGTSIEGMRAVTAGIALMIPIAVYLWARAFWGRRVATFATVLLVFSHVFIGWGRIGLHQNAALLALAVALALLVRGLVWKCPVRLLLGGIALGAGFLTYPSAQIGIVIWLLALAIMTLTRAIQPRDLLALAVPTLAGFILCAAPVLLHAVFDFPEFAQRARAVAITNPGVVETLGAAWGLEGGAVIVENIKRGFLGLNASYPYVTYYNPGHAFLDPVTGGLAWLGVAVALRRIARPGSALALSGLFVVWGTTALTEGAPVHGRLLAALPFIAVFCAVALDALLALLPTPVAGGRRSLAAAGAVLAGIAVLNLDIHHDYVRNQRATGPNDAVTAIGRHPGVGVELEGPLERYFGEGSRWDPRRHVYFVSEEGGPLFRWAASPDWHDWIAFFADSGHVHEVPTVAAFLEEGGSPGQGLWNRLTLVLPTAAWAANEAAVRARYPDLARRTLTPNRRITAVEIQR